LLLRPGTTTAAEATVLIDTGPDPAALRQRLDQLKVRRSDLLMLTHPQHDHTGSNAALTGRRTPTQPRSFPLTEADRQTAPQTPSTVAATGETWQRPGLSLRVLWPGTAEDVHRTSAAERGGGEGDAANDCSIVIEALWEDGTRLVSLGDLEPAAQQELAALGPGPAEIVKVAHHGSRFQHAPLYRQLEPDLALVPA